jgi:hydrogenase maturation protease
VRIRVIGVGTPHGDDAAGLEAAALLADGRLPAGVELARCERPAAELVELLADVDVAIVIDALAPASTPGCVWRLAPDALARTPAFSSHGLGLAEALALADGLGRRPRRVEILGIEAAELRGDALSPAARRGAAEAAALACALAGELTQER